MEKNKESVSRGAERILIREYPRTYKDDEVKFSSSSSIYGHVAQSVEQRTENPCVVGSIPTVATTIPYFKSRYFISSIKFLLICKLIFVILINFRLIRINYIDKICTTIATSISKKLYNSVTKNSYNILI